jgi:hypothetical protein
MMTVNEFRVNVVEELIRNEDKYPTVTELIRLCRDPLDVVVLSCRINKVIESSFVIERTVGEVARSIEDAILEAKADALVGRGDE